MKEKGAGRESDLLASPSTPLTRRYLGNAQTLEASIELDMVTARHRLVRLPRHI